MTADPRPRSADGTDTGDRFDYRVGDSITQLENLASLPASDAAAAASPRRVATWDRPGGHRSNYVDVVGSGTSGDTDSVASVRRRRAGE